MAGNSRLGVFIFTAASGGLPSQEVTFAKIAQQQGYQTALIGKWSLSYYYTTGITAKQHMSLWVVEAANSIAAKMRSAEFAVEPLGLTLGSRSSPGFRSDSWCKCRSWMCCRWRSNDFWVWPPRIFCRSGKWHLGLSCESRDDHCHHPNAHGFHYFFGIPLTNLRDCQPGHGTVFQIQKYLPYRTLGTVVASTVLLSLTGLISIRKLTLGLLAAAAVAAGLFGGFILIIPTFNCVLMKDHRVVEQPFASENLTQKMTHEAVDFIKR